jgi:hypothetical protein
VCAVLWLPFSLQWDGIQQQLALLHHWVCLLRHTLTTPLPCITQGAWYVLSALGLYATTPGTTEYVLGSPVFRHVRIARSAEPYEPYYERSYEQVSSAGTDAGMVLLLLALCVQSMMSCQGCTYPLRALCA